MTARGLFGRRLHRHNCRRRRTHGMGRESDLRHTFVDRVCNGEIETPWARGSEEGEPHPLEYVREDDAVKIKLEQTRLEIATRTAEKSSLEHNETDDHEQEATVGETVANENADSSPKTAQQHTTAHETLNQAIPAELILLLTQLTQRVTELAENQSTLQTAMENLTQNAHHTPAWSTRLDQTQSGHRQVGFQDTHTPPMPRQQPSRPQQTPHSRLVGGAWERRRVSRIRQIREDCAVILTRSMPAPRDPTCQIEIIRETLATLHESGG